MIFILVLIVVQIITESFPISSSGHCILLQQCAARFFNIDATAFADYDYLLHIPSALVIALVFFRQWYDLVRVVPRDFFLVAKIALLTLIAATITAVFYFIFPIAQLICLPLWLGFLITAAALYSLAYVPKKTARFDYAKAVVLGGVQACALLPGISRLGVTYVAARWLGISIRRALEISFLIQLPLIGGALALGLKKQLFDHQLLKVLNPTACLVMLMASIGAFFALRITKRWAEQEKWHYFARYLFIPASVGFMMHMLF